MEQSISLTLSNTQGSEWVLFKWRNCSEWLICVVRQSGTQDDQATQSVSWTNPDGQSCAMQVAYAQKLIEPAFLSSFLAQRHELHLQRREHA
jgi:hypothetical protein